MDDESTGVRLAGGVGNAGAVVRVGDTVRRPASPTSAMTRAIVLHLERVGFERAQRHLGIDEEQRDVFTFVAGDVPLPPYPLWAQTDDVLREVALLLLEFHQAMQGFVPPSGVAWTHELADPQGGRTICHNDVCPENVVFENGHAVALLDFDYAAPGHLHWDVARTIRMWAPMSAPATRVEWPAEQDALARFAVFAHSCGLAGEDAESLVRTLNDVTAQGQAWVRRKVEAGEPAFVQMWNTYGLEARYRADADWLHDTRAEMLAAIRRQGRQSSDVTHCDTGPTPWPSA